MDFIGSLREYFLNQDAQAEFSDIRWNKNGEGVFYINIIYPELEPAKIRCKVLKNLGKTDLVSVNPMMRFNENEYPWDSTVKSVYSVFSGMPGVSGVANRTVNGSLI